MIHTRIAAWGMVLLLGFGCISPSSSTNEAQAPAAKAQRNPAQQLLTVNCYLCHNPNTASHDVLIAPPFVAIKRRYKKAYPEREAFIEGMLAFLDQPNSQNALMKKAVERFGPMAPIPGNAEEMRKIVAYLYDEEVAVPSWFPAHFEEEQGMPWPGQ